MEPRQNLKALYFVMSLPYILAYCLMYILSRKFRTKCSEVVLVIHKLDLKFLSVYKYYIQAAEDHRGEYHLGIDQISFIRILVIYLSSGIKQGGSTIEQQLVRVITNQYERTLKRKLIEQLLALYISIRFDKDQIVSAYLQVAYLGTNITGIFELADKLGLDTSKDSKALAIEFSARLKYPEPAKYSMKWLEKYYRRKCCIVLIADKYLVKQRINAIDDVRQYSQSEQ